MNYDNFINTRMYIGVKQGIDDVQVKMAVNSVDTTRCISCNTLLYYRDQECNKTNHKNMLKSYLETIVQQSTVVHILFTHPGFESCLLFIHRLIFYGSKINFTLRVDWYIPRFGKIQELITLITRKMHSISLIFQW